MMASQDTLFRALGDPTRRTLFERLSRDGEMTVGQLTARATVSQPAVSKHLRILKDAGLVIATPRGRSTPYAARAAALAPLAEWTMRMSGFWDDRLDRLETLLTRMDQ